ncbi:MAG: hypothetical protein LBJ09_02395 [Clostridiales bacterium]|nr:hypothetical protein [Clostridiales bacterium]
MNQTIKINDLDKEDLRFIFTSCARFLIEFSKNLNQYNPYILLEKQEYLLLSHSDFYNLLCLENKLEKYVLNGYFSIEFYELFKNQIITARKEKDFYYDLFCLIHKIHVKNRFLKFLVYFWVNFCIKLKNLSGKSMQRSRIPGLYRKVMERFEKLKKDDEEIENLNSPKTANLSIENTNDSVKAGEPDVVSNKVPLKKERVIEEPLFGGNEEWSSEGLWGFDTDESNSETPKTEETDVNFEAIELPTDKITEFESIQPLQPLMQEDEKSETKTAVEESEPLLELFSDSETDDEAPIVEREAESLVELGSDSEIKPVVEVIAEHEVASSSITEQNKKKPKTEIIHGRLLRSKKDSASDLDGFFVLLSSLKNRRKEYLSLLRQLPKGSFLSDDYFFDLCLDDSVIDKSFLITYCRQLQILKAELNRFDSNFYKRFRAKNPIEYFEYILEECLFSHDLDHLAFSFDNCDQAIEQYKSDCNLRKVMSFNSFVKIVPIVSKNVKRFISAVSGLFAPRSYSIALFAFQDLRYIIKNLPRDKLNECKKSFLFREDAEKIADELNALLWFDLPEEWFLENLICYRRLPEKIVEENSCRVMVYFDTNPNETRLVTGGQHGLNFNEVMIEPRTRFATRSFEPKEFSKNEYKVVLSVEPKQAAR